MSVYDSLIPTLKAIERELAAVADQQAADSHPAPNGGEGVSRVVGHFSCGAASAVAIKLAIADYGHERVVIYNAFIAEEHEDNRRFLADCERWFEHPVIVVRDEKYGASLKLGAGRHSVDLPGCSFFCDIAEQELEFPTQPQTEVKG